MPCLCIDAESSTSASNASYNQEISTSTKQVGGLFLKGFWSKLGQIHNAIFPHLFPTVHQEFKYIALLTLSLTLQWVKIPDFVRETNQHACNIQRSM